MTLPRTLMNRWKEEGVTLLPPAQSSEIVDAFARVGSVASKEVVAFYSVFGGMEPMDDGDLKIWSLSEILADNSERSEYGPIFADYLLSCWSFRLKPVNSETSAVYVDHHDARRPPKLVAKSLAEFLANYERDPKSVGAW